jgi:phosphoenolpyruvate synthase/pyruvate phosphate dikinase
MFIKFFEQISKYDIAMAGGKGASLGEMTQAGIPVPPGFVILASAFEKFLEETDLGVEVDSILHSVNHKKIHTVENASEKIKALILEAKMPSNIGAEIKKAFKKLNTKFVAVRSSATAEDSKTAAWAGQLETYLNTTERNLLENVKKCWASLFTPRAIFYRFEKNLHKQKISVAVVVQKMIQSEVSGVAFSVHPVTQDRNQLIIEAVWGLGEALVGGQITPDSYVIEKHPWRILDKNINPQSKAIIQGRGASDIWKEIPKLQGNKQKLSDKEIIELAKLILKIENHFGFPVDVEWVREKGKFYIVQSRPITTLTPETKEVSTRTKIKFINKQSREHSLIYFYTWYEANQKQTRGFFKKVKNLIFINTGKNRKTAIWYDKDELNRLYSETGKKTRKDKRFLEKIKKEYYGSLNKILPYINGKKIRSIKELKDYYNNWIRWWAPMAVIFALPGSETATEEAKVEALRARSASEKYSDLIEKPFLKALKRLRPSLSKIVYYLKPDEIFSKIVISKTKMTEIKEREDGYVLLNGKLYSPEDLDNILKNNNFDLIMPKINLSNVIKGNSASRGHTKGRVKIIFLKKQISSFKRGQILVTEMTSPEYIPAMKKAAAIITDEGGINSHAAIISRELKKPCIIGTKIATQVLKDGDFVEIDANRGVVKILKRVK